MIYNVMDTPASLSEFDYELQCLRSQVDTLYADRHSGRIDENLMSEVRSYVNGYVDYSVGRVLDSFAHKLYVLLEEHGISVSEEDFNNVFKECAVGS